MGFDGEVTEKLPWEKGRPAAEGHSKPRKPHKGGFRRVNALTILFPSSHLQLRLPISWPQVQPEETRACWHLPSPPHRQERGYKSSTAGTPHPKISGRGERAPGETTATDGLWCLDWLFCQKAKRKKLKGWINLFKIKSSSRGRKKVGIFQTKFWKKAYNQNIIRICEIQSCFCCRSNLGLSKHLQQEVKALQRTSCMFIHLYLYIYLYT